MDFNFGWLARAPGDRKVLESRTAVYDVIVATLASRLVRLLYHLALGLGVAPVVVACTSAWNWFALLGGVSAHCKSFAATFSYDTWCRFTLRRMQQLGVPAPEEAGIGPGSSRDLRRRYMRSDVARIPEAVDTASWRSCLAQSSDAALQVYADLVPRPMTASVHSWRVSPHGAAAWAR